MARWARVSPASLIVRSCGAWIFVRGDAGWVLVAIRENESRCEYPGINISPVKILLPVACAVVAAMAGYGFAGVQMVVAPDYAGYGFGTELMIGMALGGRGTLISQNPVDHTTRQGLCIVLV